MIEATCIEFYNIVADKTAAESAMLKHQNEGWKILSVFAWTMGTIGVVYNRETNIVTIASTFSRSDIPVVSTQAKRGRPAKVR